MLLLLIEYDKPMLMLAARIEYEMFDLMEILLIRSVDKIDIDNADIFYSNRCPE